MGFFSSLFGPSEEEKEQQASEEKKEAKKREWEDPYEKVKYVCEGGKVQCKYCSSPIASIKVTAQTEKLQDKPWATVGDNNGKVNLDFTGLCTHHNWGSHKPPCKDVISLGAWKNYADTIVGQHNALMVQSTIPCLISNEDLTIVNSGQTATLEQISPLEGNCRVEFEVDENDTQYQHGEFGFDSYMKAESDGLFIDENAKGTARSPHYKVDNILGKEYTAPFVSMSKNQTITLKVKVKTNDNFSGKIEFENNDEEFIFTPKELTSSTTQVTIKCNCLFDNNKTIYVKSIREQGSITEKSIVGAIQFFANKTIIEVNMRTVIVNIEGKNANRTRDREAVDKLIFGGKIKTTLDEYFRYAFTPAFIRININNQTSEVLNIPDVKDFFKKEKEREKDLEDQASDYVKKNGEGLKRKEKSQKKAEKLEELKKEDRQKRITARIEAAKQKATAAGEEWTQAKEAEERDQFDIDYYKCRVAQIIRDILHGDNELRMYPEGNADEKETSYENLIAEAKDRIKKIEKNPSPTGKMLYAISLYRKLEKKKEPDMLTLYLSYISCEEGDPNQNSGKDYKAVGGISETQGDEVLMFLKNQKLHLYKDIPHEVMHNLSLVHTFDDCYKKGETINYMDYHDLNKYPSYFVTWCRQWQRMQIAAGKRGTKKTNE